MNNVSLKLADYEKCLTCRTGIMHYSSQALCEKPWWIYISWGIVICVLPKIMHLMLENA